MLAFSMQFKLKQFFHKILFPYKKKLVAVSDCVQITKCMNERMNGWNTRYKYAYPTHLYNNYKYKYYCMNSRVENHTFNIQRKRTFGIVLSVIS